MLFASSVLTLLLNLPNSLKALALVGSTFSRPAASVNIFNLSHCHVKNMRGNGEIDLINAECS